MYMGLHVYNVIGLHGQLKFFKNVKWPRIGAFDLALYVYMAILCAKLRINSKLEEKVISSVPGRFSQGYLPTTDWYV